MKNAIFTFTLILCLSCLFGQVSAEDHKDIYKQLGLTEEEIIFLKDNRIFYYAISNEYPPVEYMGSNLTPKGFGVEYLKKASELLGVEFILREGAEKLNWKNCLELIKNKEIDLLPAASHTDDRNRYMLFTKPYITENTVVIGHKGSDVILTEKDFEGKRLAFVEGHWQNDYIRRELENPKIINMDSIEKTLYSVEKGTVDYTFLDNIVYIYYLQKNGLKNTQISGRLNIKASHQIGLNMDQEVLRNILDKVIDYVPKDEVYKNALIVEAREDVNKKLLVGSLLLTGLLILIIIILNRKLFNEYKYRRKMRENKEILIENLSHDLKTPLATLKVNFGLLKKGLVKEEDINHYYERIRNNIDNLDDIITELYNINDMKEDFMSLKKHRVSVGDFLEEIFERNRGIFEAQNKTLYYTNKTNQQIECKVKINKKTIDRAITNLLSNSLKFTKDGGVVSIGYALEGRKVVISIADNGIGMDKKELTVIFDRFYKTDNNPFRNGKGIGLSIAKEIVEFHGGEITASSEIDKFTCFQIKLPVDC